MTDEDFEEENKYNWGRGRNDKFVTGEGDEKREKIIKYWRDRKMKFLRKGIQTIKGGEEGRGGKLMMEGGTLNSGSYENNL